MVGIEKGICPHCHCPDYSVIGEQEDPRGRLVEMRQCEHCRRLHYGDFENPTIELADVPRFRSQIRPACPVCGSESTRVTSAPRARGAVRIRRHKCQECGEPFKSLENRVDSDQ